MDYILLVDARCKLITSIFILSCDNSFLRTVGTENRVFEEWANYHLRVVTKDAFSKSLEWVHLQCLIPALLINVMTVALFYSCNFWRNFQLPASEKYSHNSTRPVIIINFCSLFEDCLCIFDILCRYCRCRKAIRKQNKRTLKHHAMNA